MSDDAPKPIARVKNWQEFQHYRDRKPPWIKLHRNLLDDYDYACLHLASRAIAPCIWLIASESTDGSICLDPDYLVFRLRCDKEDIIEGVKGLISKGFLIPDSATLPRCYQDACLETETEVEKELEKETEREKDGGSSEPLSTFDKRKCDVVGSEPPAVPPEDPANGKHPRCPYQEILDAYHEHRPELPKVRKLTDSLKKFVRARWREDTEYQTLDFWNWYFGVQVGQCPHLLGNNGRGWTANFEWLVRPQNFTKVVNGAYLSRDGPRQKYGERGAKTAENAWKWLQKQEGENG